MDKLINIYGKKLSEDPKKLNIIRKPEYKDENGTIKFGKEYSKDADKNGFDVKFEKKEKKLISGEIYARFGSEAGRYLTLPGIPYQNLSMPYLVETVPFHIYQVNPDYKGTDKFVTEGIVASDFEQPGGGIQYYTGKHDRVLELLQDEILIEIPATEYLIKK